MRMLLWQQVHMHTLLPGATSVCIAKDIWAQDKFTITLNYVQGQLQPTYSTVSLCKIELKVLKSQLTLNFDIAAQYSLFLGCFLYVGEKVLFCPLLTGYTLSLQNLFQYHSP